MSTIPDITEPATPATVAPGQVHTISIQKVAHGGGGIGSINGMTVFVAGALPGQQVQITVTKKRDNYAEARLDKVLKKSMDEIPARCPHFGSCGGCTWQNLPYNKQIVYKEQIVRETLEKETPVDDAVRATLPGRVLSIIPSPQVFYYRNKLEMSFGFETMRHEERGGKRIYFDENPSVGFHQPGEWSTILPITECHLYEEETSTLLMDVRRFLQETRLPVYNPKTHKGLLRTMLLRRGVHTGEHMIAFTVNGKKKELEAIFQQFMRFAGRPNLTSLLLIENTGLNDKPEMPKVHALVGGETISEHLFDLTFEISPFSFFQTNTLGTEKLYQVISQMADLSDKDTVLDAYCGMGTIGQYLARFCQKVVGIESNPSCIEDALRSAGKNRVANISFYKGRAEQVLQQQLMPGGKYAFDVVVVDPPRAGLHPDALNAVLAHKPRQIVYVSCNPATFARDLGVLLKGGYDLRAVQPVDMFPHTAHIEMVSVLQRS